MMLTIKRKIETSDKTSSFVLHNEKKGGLNKRNNKLQKAPHPIGCIRLNISIKINKR